MASLFYSSFAHILAWFLQGKHLAECLGINVTEITLMLSLDESDIIFYNSCLSVCLFEKLR
ncbi:MAG: hypothetical protein F6K50_27665 [Moorea sp. SIO3I7]|uniref:hypothetical protein n=1 Tax=unclassified Moorena TaxID=2683338 RepID=UPI0013CCC643|nr:MULTISPECIES: hypothetical protein [unclassified Moorena]NEN99129.1 hypothetical protein [Moorena sp. SIO3I7]NEO48705.1 hypothetical protein [Moorena sp. SIO4A3]NEO66867.1 hypothetical protein [Moorena sp. SIO4G2]NEO12856.1 hypothetical protein [Moorena sp. SIO3E8]NEQ01629.1 hypothetical protein [Moorena sp. SIO3F7]